MYAEVLNNLFCERELILRDELKNIIQIKNENSFSQALSNMVLFGLIKRLENGIYYIQSSNKKFKNLKPSMNERLQVIPQINKRSYEEKKVPTDQEIEYIERKI
ncbi:MAG: hypothetical protein PHC62_10150 [Candidatus Izemoplasmatales bacterium]|nr:hypothetical protein [Candidatus Izemoplasmatales bacterium]